MVTQISYNKKKMQMVFLAWEQHIPVFLVTSMAWKLGFTKFSLCLKIWKSTWKLAMYVNDT